MNMEKMTKEWPTVTLEEMQRMSEVDPRTVDKSTLADIADVEIHSELGGAERIADFIRQIKNPYCYLDHGMVVKVSFSGTRGELDRIRDCLS